MTRYAHDVEATAAGLTQARADYLRHAGSPGSPDPQDTPGGPGSFPAWLRWASYQRRAEAHRNNLHWWHRLDSNDAVCTCGLLHERPAPPVETVYGHREAGSWEPINVLVIVDAATPQHYVALCQRCEWRAAAPTPAEAFTLINPHHENCPRSDQTGTGTSPPASTEWDRPP